MESEQEKMQEDVTSVQVKPSIQNLFNRASFDGERILLKAGEAIFGIVPIEDVLLLNEEGL